MTTRREICVALGIVPLALASGTAAEASATTRKRAVDEELFLAAAKDLAEAKFRQARQLLATLVNSYPESPLVGQARFLLFFSYARERPSHQGAGEILKQIEMFLNSVDQ